MMNLKNKEILIIVGLLFLVFLLIKRVKKMSDFKQVLQKFKNEGVLYETSKVIEQIYRNETAHFTSKQFNKTFSAGMEGFSNDFPYGWITLNSILWQNNPDLKPIGLIEFRDNHTGQVRPFLVFQNLESAMRTLLAFINYYDNPYRWNSTDENIQSVYRSRLDKINTPLTNSVYD